MSNKRQRGADQQQSSPDKRAKKTTASSEFHVVDAALTVSVPPVFATNPRAGVQEMLDSMVMRYIPAFRGVVLSHSDLIFTKKHATIKNDCPFLVCSVGFNATVWSPKVGMKLVGKVNLCSPDHVSLLIHRTFNASIPRQHLPEDRWQFEYGPAENDPEFGPEAADAVEVSESEGRWVDRATGERLGGEHGDVEFTVTGLTVANEMLSLQGSLYE